MRALNSKFRRRSDRLSHRHSWRRALL